MTDAISIHVELAAQERWGFLILLRSEICFDLETGSHPGNSASHGIFFPSFSPRAQEQGARWSVVRENPSERRQAWRGPYDQLSFGFLLSFVGAKDPVEAVTEVFSRHRPYRDRSRARMPESDQESFECPRFSPDATPPYHLLVNLTSDEGVSSFGGFESKIQDIIHWNPAPVAGGPIHPQNGLSCLSFASQPPAIGFSVPCPLDGHPAFYVATG